MVLQCCEPGVSLDALVIVIVIRLITQQLWDGVIRKTMGVYFWMKKNSTDVRNYRIFSTSNLIHDVCGSSDAVSGHRTWNGRASSPYSMVKKSKQLQICAFAGIGILTLSTYNEQLAAKVIDCTYLILPTIQVLTTATLLSVMVRNDQEKLCHSFSTQN
ncbi:hypothetical protein KUF71_000544 [Frankliniella fusca]|uniref:Uncharacterized protein n=1 Tax=Frankliniella fusca TaxID=407009 RepID=A0AAE1HVL6_9NEOP|nr:hypothetical protein KUF71_000544 [Frankliniella fusca]